MSKGAEKERVKSSVVVDRLDSIIQALRGKDTKNVRWAGDQHSPNTDRTIKTTRTRLAINGTFTILKIRIVSGSPARDLYVRVSLEDEQQQFKGDICSGYVEATRQPHGAGGLVVEAGDYIRVDSWGYVTSVIQPVGTILQDKQIPGGWNSTLEGSLDGSGKLRVITGNNPAAGVEVNETVPTGARWKVYALTVLFTTSTLTGNRRTTFTVDDGTSSFLYKITGLLQGGSLAIAYYFGKYIADDSTAVYTSIRTQIPEPLWLLASWRIRIQIGDGKTGDDFGAPTLYVEEWLEA